MTFSLSQLGWDSYFESAAASVRGDASWLPARVIGEERGLYRVQTAVRIEPFWASVSGRQQFEARGRADYPAVGDWLLVELVGDRAVVRAICPRRSLIQRKQVESADIQILATNVDTLFVMTSLNEDLNLRRLERYLVMAAESGTRPVVLLSKADQAADPAGELARAQQAFTGAPVHAVSRDRFDEATFLADYVKPGTTSAFVGSSGVGKSTLVNYLIGEDRLRTQASREGDDKGRHTTTSRGLYQSRFGGSVIDTPGMRELQLADHAEGMQQQFADIEELLPRCRFSDCGHQSEPGCAVKAALDAGSLDMARWNNYQKIVAEVRFGQIKLDKALASQEKKKWKRLTGAGRERSKAKRGSW